MLKRCRRFLTLPYLVLTAVISAVLILLASATIFFKFGDTSFQVADGLFLALTLIVPGPLMCLSGMIYPLIFDLLGGGIIFIPLSVIIHILMFSTIKALKRFGNFYWPFLLAVLWIFAYVPFNYWINLGLGSSVASSLAIRELIVDMIQVVVTIATSLILTFVFRRAKLNVYLETRINRMLKSSGH